MWAQWVDQESSGSGELAKGWVIKVLACDIRELQHHHEGTKKPSKEF